MLLQPLRKPDVLNTRRSSSSYHICTVSYQNCNRSIAKRRTLITYQTGCGIVYGASLGLYWLMSIAALLRDGLCASLK